MAQKNEEDDYKMKMYEAQADAIQKQEEIDKLNKEMVEIRQKLEEQNLNSIRLSSIEEQVTNAVKIITANVVSLQKNVKELSEKMEDRLRNHQISQEKMEQRITGTMEEIKEKMTQLEMKMTTETSEQNTLRHSVNCLIKQNIEATNSTVDSVVHKVRMKTKTISFMNSTQILLTGGWDGEYASSDMFLLDYNEKAWKYVSIELPLKLADHGTVILNDELYIIGGYTAELKTTCDSLHRLNKQMQWEKLTNMQEQRGFITNSCLSHNGCIWVIGGCQNDVPLNTIERYNPAVNRWEEKPAMKRQRAFAAAAVINNKIYVCGGNDDISVEVFDINSEIWTDFCSLPEPRYNVSIIVNGTSIILIGGFNDPSFENTVWKMDVENIDKQWVYLPSLSKGRSGYTVHKVETECMLVLGGKINEPRQYSDAVEIFNGQKWEPFTTLPEPRRDHSSVVLTPTMVEAFLPYILQKEEGFSRTQMRRSKRLASTRRRSTLK